VSKQGRAEAAEKVWAIMHLTNTDPRAHDSAVASKEAVGAPEEIEITPPMLKAGLEAYALWDREDDWEYIVIDVYRSMEMARRKAKEAVTADVRVVA